MVRPPVLVRWLLTYAAAGLSLASCFLSGSGTAPEGGGGEGPAVASSSTGMLGKMCSQNGGQCDDHNPCTSDSCDETGHCNPSYPNNQLVPPQDSNPCDQEVCLNGAIAHENLAAGTSCGKTQNGDPLTCDGNGHCIGCMSAGDCGKDTVCVTWSCDKRMCSYSQAPDGVLQSGQTSGDCADLVCADGVEGAQQNTSDVPPPPSPCTLYVCPSGSCNGTMCPAPMLTNAAAGTSCGPSGEQCDGSGNCGSCSDGVQDGMETGVDCGGPTCPQCLGGPCNNLSDCGAGAQACVDDVCCNSLCDKPCEVCTVAQGATQDGTCTPVTSGDPKLACGVQGCGVNGLCACSDGTQDGNEKGVDCGGGICPGCGNGTVCDGSNDCANGNCVNGYCCAASQCSVCEACDVPGSEGTCANVQEGDTTIGCNGLGVACDGSGLCKTATGYSCVTDAACASGSCEGTCSMSGDTCSTLSPCPAVDGGGPDLCINFVCQ